MCGIVGLIAARGFEAPGTSGLNDAIHALHHRGPSESGAFVSGPALLGSTRLSIIDLEGGSQPMHNEDGSVVVVYNGEIWNYRALRESLLGRGHQFRTQSDTEVLVHGWEEWGEQLPDRLDGMFAFAVWDTRSERLFLARDRLGKKPLYIHAGDRGLAFGSDARSIFLISGLRPTIAREHVSEYLFQRYLVSPRTLFAGVERLSPGHSLEYDRRNQVRRRYWKIDPPTEPRPLPPDELRELLLAATSRRLMSDVPVGVLLSGGVDSTAVLALAREAGAESLSTYTVGFADPLYDERARARRAARHFGTDHHELEVEPDDFLAAWPRLAWYRDDPIAEASEIPLLLLSEFAGRHVRVALSGDGGDEVFGGYPKYRADALLRGGGVVASLALRAGLYLLSLRRTHRQLDRAARTLAIRDPLVRWVSWFRTMESDVVESLLARSALEEPIPANLSHRLGELLRPYDALDDGRRMLLGDLFTYLPDNMLLRSDKVLMGGSLEGRMPLLDAELVRRATAAPANSRAALTRSKRVLREATETFVPDKLRGGPKRGFPVPLERFLRAEGRDLAQRLLLSDRSLERGVFDPDALRSGTGDGAGGGGGGGGRGGETLTDAALFVLTSFELWARANVDAVTPEPPPVEALLDDDAERVADAAAMRP